MAKRRTSADPARAAPDQRLASARLELDAQQFFATANPGTWRARAWAVFAHSVKSFGGIMGKALGFAAVRSSTLMGLTPQVITVEVSCTKGPPCFR